MPTLVLLAGPNGAGKTTFIDRVLRRRAESFAFVHPDEVARDLPFLSSSSGKRRSRADRGTQRRARARPCREHRCSRQPAGTDRLRRRWVPRSRCARRRMTKGKGDEGRKLLDWGPR